MNHELDQDDIEFRVAGQCRIISMPKTQYSLPEFGAWVPAIDKFILEGDFRSFEMDGMWEITEKILLLDNPTMTLKYSAIATPTPIEHHLATMTVSPVNTLSCQLEWETEIDPEILADRIHQGMLVSIEGIKNVLSKGN
mgnify:CR=1 FL=1